MRDASPKLRAELSNAYARLETEHQRLIQISELAKDAGAVAVDDILEPPLDDIDIDIDDNDTHGVNDLAASFAASIAALPEEPELQEPPRTLEGFPQPEDLGFEIDIGSEEQSNDGNDLMPAPPSTPPYGNEAPASIDLDDPFADDEPAPAPAPFVAEALPDPAPQSEHKPGWLDEVLRAYVDDDPLRVATIVANPRLKRHHCKDLEEVQLSGLLQRAPRTLEELTRLSNSDEATVRSLIEQLVNKGLVELR